jgi:hypothetical protein
MSDEGRAYQLAEVVRVLAEQRSLACNNIHPKVSIQPAEKNAGTNAPTADASAICCWSGMVASGVYVK